MKLTGNNLVIVNILASYGRIVFVAGLALFSTRWVLNALGEVDFGLYSVVGGLIGFGLFFGTVMAGSVQRFFAYAIGQGDTEEVKRWFNTAFALHALFSLILVLIMAPIGIYLLDNVMQIPPGRLQASHWVFILSLIGSVETMLVVPSIGMFTAKQRIFELAFWGVVQGIFNFLIAYYLFFSKNDLLLTYSVGVVLCKLLLDFVQFLRARILFPECKLQCSYWFDKERAAKMLSFTFWNAVGAISSILRNQGTALLMNKFAGVRANAAFGIANTVAGQTSLIASAMYNAVSPEITTREGAGERERMISLSLRASKFSMLLTFLWLIPIYIEIDYILKIWLKNPPIYASEFCRIILLTYAADKLSIGYWGAISAYGKLAGYQLTMAGFHLFAFCGVFLAFILDFPPEWCLWPMLLSGVLLSLGRVFWVKKLLGVPVTRWIKEVLFKCIYVVIFPIICSFILFYKIEQSFLRFILISIITIILNSIFSWLFALDLSEKCFVIKKIKNIKKYI